MTERPCSSVVTIFPLLKIVRIFGSRNAIHHTHSHKFYFIKKNYYTGVSDYITINLYILFLRLSV